MVVHVEHWQVVDFTVSAQTNIMETIVKKFSGSGANSRLRKDHCARSPCQNGGDCVSLNTTYYCRCKIPYYGINCNKHLSKREEIVDESNSSEQEFNINEDDLERHLKQVMASEGIMDIIE
ncbi:unnamed protein product [Rotaria sp. Silwood2]|nr:unnamed protein product [Rotaria sp. Silwood2]CAF3090800.1 unnamed protein product [Rotaria sp. Silwood2]CAF3946871.1 unnamed protein product [Rotaria sp. Silwood2]CAF4061181.1 unnamed protein product [Rotaria sp. Silwood2]